MINFFVISSIISIFFYSRIFEEIVENLSIYLRKKNHWLSQRKCLKVKLFFETKLKFRVI